MRKSILMVLSVLAVSIFIIGCAEPQNVDVVDQEGSVVGQAVRYSAGKYQVKADADIVARCVTKTVKDLCPQVLAGSTPMPNDVCGTLDDGCGGKVSCNECGDVSLTGLVCTQNTCVKTGTDLSSSATCTDTDGGVKPLTAGTVTLGAANGVQKYSDVCKGTTQVVEYSCSGNKVVGAVVDCAESCVNGACTVKLN
ncbi:MAG: hypothetical protein AABX05_04370 [Nanoarchaeota archaeon]